ncbi:MAG TPA: hypothetical protein VM599_00340, partial [Thermoanaerobaculia bacterium]|nr:hypothetical protein [Thermoanaerobaculia bacterium]
LALHEGGRPLDLHLWTLVSFELWCRTFLDRGARAAAAPAAPVPAPPEPRPREPMPFVREVVSV